MSKYAVFLRGINVGGNKKVPMAELKKVFEEFGAKNVKTLLNTGNVVFETDDKDISSTVIAKVLAEKFGFSIPTLLFPFSSILEIVDADPFKQEKATDKTRFYVTFLGPQANPTTEVSYASEDQSFRIIGKNKNALFSILDLAKCPTPQAMNILEKTYGLDITTRNYNTVTKVAKL